jgi:hypothetical protein
MNTDPLPSIAPQQNPGLSTKTLREHEPGLRELILGCEMDSIWRTLAGLAQSQCDSERDVCDKTQDMFLRLLSDQRFSAFVDENWSEEEIGRELMSLMRSQFDS